MLGSLVLSVILCPLAIVAQDATSTTSSADSVIRSAGTIVTTSAPVSESTGVPATETYCWQYITVQDYVASVSLAVTDSVLPSDAVCYEAYSTDGGLEAVPFTTVPSAATDTALPSIDIPIITGTGAMATSTAAASSGGGQSVKEVVGAVVGAVVGVGVVFGCLAVYFLRKAKKIRIAEQQKRRTWTDRPGGWFIHDTEKAQIQEPATVHLVLPKPSKKD